MEIYDYYKEKYPQFDWESIDHHGFTMAIRQMGLCKTHEEAGVKGLYGCEIIDNQVYGYIGDSGIRVKGYIDKEVEESFIISLETGLFYELAKEYSYMVFW